MTAMNRHQFVEATVGAAVASAVGAAAWERGMASVFSPKLDEKAELHAAWRAAKCGLGRTAW